jgi:hypothetical protein
MDFFLGLLHSPGRIVRAFSGHPSKETLTNMAGLMHSEEFWDGLVIETDSGEIGRAAGRLVEVISVKNARRWERLANMLVLGVVGLSDDPFLWIEAENKEPEGAQISLSLHLHSLAASNIDDARQMFSNEAKVPIADILLKEREVTVVLQRRG